MPSGTIGPVGYDLHLTRADDWPDSELTPVGLDEWVVAARASDALVELESEYPPGVPGFLLGDDPVSSPALYWADGEVVVRGSDQAHVSSLVALATAIGARVVGDDGEVYGDSSPVLPPPPSPPSGPSPTSPSGEVRRGGLFRRRRRDG